MSANNNMGQNQPPVFNFNTRGEPPASLGQAPRVNDVEFNAVETRYAGQRHPFPAMAAQQELGRPRRGGKTSRSKSRRVVNKSKNSKSRRNGGKSTRSKSKRNNKKSKKSKSRRN
jgi:hypothetical protein